jgi:hypothetical protein
VVAAHMIDAGVKMEVTFESLSLMAPALRIDDYKQKLAPHLAAGSLRRLLLFHLSEQAEQDDRSCGAYRHSLLNLVSRSFEDGNHRGEGAPLFGLARHHELAFAKAASKPAALVTEIAPGPHCAASSHGGFDNDHAARRRIIEFIRKG